MTWYFSSNLAKICADVDIVSFSSLSGFWPCLDLQSVHASLLVDGERSRVQGDAYQSAPLLGTRGPQIYFYIWLFVGFPVHRGGSLLAADPPGCKYLSSSRCSSPADTSQLLGLNINIKRFLKLISGFLEELWQEGVIKSVSVWFKGDSWIWAVLNEGFYQIIFPLWIKQHCFWWRVTWWSKRLIYPPLEQINCSFFV